MNSQLNIRVISSIDDTEGWEYRNSNTKEFTHCLHAYPAMMIPQIPRRLLNYYVKSKEALLFDPYCGTGTSLVEALLFGINCIGTDINPLAQLIACVKTTPIDPVIIKFQIDNFKEFIDKESFILTSEQINREFIDKWFKQVTIDKLLHIKNYIDTIEIPAVKNFFKAAFSETVRESSLTRNGEFKLLKIEKEKLADFNPNVYIIFFSKLNRNYFGLLDFLEIYNEHMNKPTATIYGFNTVNHIPKSIIDEGEIDIVITSPPYGDSHTTVAYGQYSRLSNEWLEVTHPETIDRRLMGGKKKSEVRRFNIDLLDYKILEINNIDEKRAAEVYSFYCDLNLSIINISNVIKPKGYACYVIGDRIVKGVKLPTHKAIIEFFEKNNFKHIDTFSREIPNKRMPLRNSPSNIKGKTESTMVNEYIIVMK
ncbi:MAG: DNA methyltransferase, partial [Bacteroidetes bacterium]|nr:DNA methyltransferase [Bacteroidota bacterium]